MSNWKHTAIALVSVMTVVSMSVLQLGGTFSAMADEADEAAIAILSGDGEGETPAFADFNDSELLAQAEEAAFEVKTGYISYSAGSVNVRSEASKEAEIIGSLVLGDSFEVTALSEDGLWYAVTLSDGTSGYIMCDLISFDFEQVKREMLSSTMYETATASVSGGKLNVRNKPSEDGSVVIDQVADGAVLYITDRTENGWLKVIFGADYDTGYVMSSYVTVGDMVQRTDVDNARADRISSVSKKGTVVTNSSYVNVRNAPSENAEAVASLKNGDTCTIISQGSKWTKIVNGNGVAYVISSAVLDDAALADYNTKKAAAAQRAANVTAKTSGSTKKEAVVAVNSSMGAKIIAEAEKYIGTKYVYGGSSPSGFDCSGLVQYVMKKVGISVNRSSRDQYKNGVAVSRANLAAGDLVFFSKGGSITHVGIYAGNGKVLHSPSPGKTVCYTTLDHMCSYSTYVGARRVY
ncbi:MAG: SH3 domain-containing protein [Clostridia bacterium]|nr:SH3 domain-containing protein [Clostridia bacterium]